MDRFKNGLKQLPWKNMFKTFLIPWLICTLMFIVSPSLNLRKILTDHMGDVSIAYLKKVALFYSIRGYLLALILIALCCYLFKKFPFRVVLWWGAGTLCIFGILSWNTEFPTIGQLSLVWAYDDFLWEASINRYKLLLTYLRAWIISCGLAILCLRTYYKSHMNRNSKNG